METAWGWTVAGLAGVKDSSGARVAFLSTEDQSLKDDVKKIFCHDFPREEEVKSKLSRQAEYAQQQLKESVKWIAEKGKYSCGLPHKYGREKTAEILNKVDSRSMAEK